MTDIANSKENHISYNSDTGKTSPLSALPTSSPSVLKGENPIQYQMTIDSELDTSITANSTKDKASKMNADPDNSTRSRSIVSDESSDLSDLDSEAETEKMFNGDESQLAKLVKPNNSTTAATTTAEEDSTLQPDDNDTFIKEEVINELNKEKGNTVDAETNEEIGEVVQNLKNNNQIEESKEPNVEEEGDENKDEGSQHDREEIKPSKRKLSDVLGESTKRTKIEDDVHEKEQHPNGGDHEVENEGEDEEEEEEEVEEEEEEEEEELTEEQKIQKQKDMEAEAEKQKQRKEAIEFLTEIEIDFAKLRDRLYDDKMERFKSELAMCLDGSHPELQSVYSKIDAHREEKIRLASLTQKYKLESIARKTKAQRTAIHQQFFKRISEFKTNYLRELTETWYEINKERRTMDLLVPDYSYRIPKYTDQLIEQREQLNKEISVLVGLNQYYGFPKAPELSSVEGNELDNDLRAMNIL